MGVFLIENGPEILKVEILENLQVYGIAGLFGIRMCEATCLPQVKPVASANTEVCWDGHYPASWSRLRETPRLDCQRCCFPLFLV